MKMDIFFFITAMAVIVFTSALVWALVYLIRILRDLSEISTIVKKGAEDVDRKIRDIKKHVTSNKIVDFIWSKIKSTKKSRNRKSE